MTSSTIDPAVGAVLKECGLGADAAWKHKQSGKWIVKHWALEVAAAHKGIIFSPPTIVSADPANKIATIIVTGALGDRTEWSFGEAAPYNTTQTYPFAMAEKRAKDRVVLKLLQLSGRAYSEEEADDFKAPPANGDRQEPRAPQQPEPTPFDADKPAPVEEWANKNWTADVLDVRQMKLEDTKVGTTMNALIDMINLAPTRQRLNEFVQDNAPTLKWLSENKAEIHGRVNRAIDAKRGIFAQSPNGNKEAA